MSTGKHNITLIISSTRNSEKPAWGVPARTGTGVAKYVQQKLEERNYDVTVLDTTFNNEGKVEDEDLWAGRLEPMLKQFDWYVEALANQREIKGIPE